MSRWYVTDSRGSEVAECGGDSKKESSERFVAKMRDTQGENKPWVFWRNCGYKLRRRSG